MQHRLLHAWGRQSQRPSMDLPRSSPALLVRVPGALCAFPLAEVIETMRPLPVEPLANTPDFIQGMARIRGAAVPVVELTALFQGDHRGEIATRFVTLRVGQRCVALAVQSVIGIADLNDQAFDNLPPLLKTVRTELIRTLGTLDAEFLVVLNTARLVPDSVWRALAQTKAATP
jgi:purine-binding chemotaxis protein CheW